MMNDAVAREPRLLLNKRGLCRAMIIAMDLGLAIGPPLNEACVVTRFNNKNGMVKVEFWPMVAGLIKLATNAGIVIYANGSVVYENDHFEVDQGTKQEVSFSPARKNRGDRLCTFAFANLQGNNGAAINAVTVISEAEMAEIMACSDNVGPSSMWAKFPDEARVAKALRRLLKRLPLSSHADALEAQRLCKALDLDNEAMNFNRKSLPPGASKPKGMKRLREGLMEQQETKKPIIIDGLEGEADEQKQEKETCHPQGSD